MIYWLINVTADVVAYIVLYMYFVTYVCVLKEKLIFDDLALASRRTFFFINWSTTTL